MTAEQNDRESNFSRFWRRYAEAIHAVAGTAPEKKWSPDLPTAPAQLMLDHKTTMGATYRDKVTGFEGVALAKAQYLTGCDQTCLQPAKLKDGKIADSLWFDDMRLELIPEAGTIRVVSPFGPRTNAPLRGADIAAPKMSLGGGARRV